MRQRSKLLWLKETIARITEEMMVEIIVMLLIQWTPTSCVNYCCCHLVAKVHVLSRKKTFLSSQEQGGVLKVRDYLPPPPPVAERWAVSKPSIPTLNPEGCHGGFSVSVRDEECICVELFMEKQTSHKRTSLWREREKKKGSFSLIKKPDRVGVGSTL